MRGGVRPGELGEPDKCHCMDELPSLLPRGSSHGGGDKELKEADRKHLQGPLTWGSLSLSPATPPAPQPRRCPPQRMLSWGREGSLALGAAR